MRPNFPLTLTLGVLPGVPPADPSLGGDIGSAGGTHGSTLLDFA